MCVYIYGYTNNSERERYIESILNTRLRGRRLYNFNETTGDRTKLMESHRYVLTHGHVHGYRQYNENKDSIKRQRKRRRGHVSHKGRKCSFMGSSRTIGRKGLLVLSLSFLFPSLSLSLSLSLAGGNLYFAREKWQRRRTSYISPRQEIQRDFPEREREKEGGRKYDRDCHLGLFAGEATAHGRSRVCIEFWAVAHT